MTLWDRLLQKGTSVTMVRDEDSIAQIFNMVGSFGLGFGFIILGIVIFFTIPTVYPPTAARKISSSLLGWFLVFAGLSRLFDAVAYWENYVMLRGLFKMLGTTLFLIICAFVPKVMKQLKNFKSVMELKKELEETNKKMDAVTEIGNKLTHV